MASGEAWQTGWSLGSQLAAQQKARKEALSDEARETHLGELQQNIGTLQQKYSSLLGAKGEETPESLKAKYALSQALQQRDAILNPQQKPNAVGKIGQKIGEVLHLAKKPEEQATTMQPAQVQIPAATTGTTLAATPEYETTTRATAPAAAAAPAPAAPSTKGAASAKPAAEPAQVRAAALARSTEPTPRITKATEAGTAEAALPPMEAALPSVKIGRPTTVKGPAMTAAQLRAQAQANQRAQQETDLLAAAAPLTPAQQAVQQAQAGTAGMMETVRGNMDAIKAFHPDATPEELKKLTDNYLDTVLGTTDKKLTFKPLAGSKPYKGPDGRYYQSMQNSLTGEIEAQPMPEGYTPPPERPLSPAAQNMRALVKRNQGLPLTEEDKAVLKSYDEQVYKTTVVPGVARMVAAAQARPMVVVNPFNPNQTMVVSAGQAERGGYMTPASMTYQVNLAGRKAMIPRGLGSNLAALGTAEDHLRMASGMVDALGTGNIVALNRLGLAWSQATGDPAPTNFETVKTSLEGEMARAFTGVGATQGEIAAVGSIINKANSPQALKDALNYAGKTMEARKRNLWSTVQQAATFAPTGGGAPTPSSPQRKPTQTKGKSLADRLNDALGGQ